MNHSTLRASSAPQARKSSGLLEARGITSPTIAILAVIGLLGYFQVVHNGFAALAVLLIVMSEFVRRMDRGIPLMQITAVIATLQWLIGPSITYYLGYVHGRYFMYVPDFYYFSYALPATCLYCIGVMFFGGTLDQKRLLGQIDRQHFFKIGVLLVAVSFASQMIAPKMPGGLAFFFHLCSQLRYVGALYFLFSDHQVRYISQWLRACRCFLPLPAAACFMT